MSTKKDFETSAAILHRRKPTKRNDDGTTDGFDLWAGIVGDFANEYASQNPRFDRVRFERACVNGLDAKSKAA